MLLIAEASQHPLSYDIPNADFKRDEYKSTEMSAIASWYPLTQTSTFINEQDFFEHVHKEINKKKTQPQETVII